MNDMLMETYLRQQVDKGEYGVAIIQAQIALDIANYIEKHRQPTIEPERKTGEWEEIEVIADAYDIGGVKTWASKMKCDQCGFTTIAVEGHFSQYNFCPHCGAELGEATP